MCILFAPPMVCTKIVIVIPGNWFHIQYWSQSQHHDCPTYPDCHFIITIHRCLLSTFVQILYIAPSRLSSDCHCHIPIVIHCHIIHTDITRSTLWLSSDCHCHPQGLGLCGSTRLLPVDEGPASGGEQRTYLWRINSINKYKWFISQDLICWCYLWWQQIALWWNGDMFSDNSSKKIRTSIQTLSLQDKKRVSWYWKINKRERFDYKDGCRVYSRKCELNTLHSAKCSSA